VLFYKEADRSFSHSPLDMCLIINDTHINEKDVIALYTTFPEPATSNKLEKVNFAKWEKNPKKMQITTFFTNTTSV